MAQDAHVSRLPSAGRLSLHHLGTLASWGYG